ncbi:glycosyltransferase [Aquiflexum lacus]|uniref:glycosyltransferase n=1 Tax=Aquiflexum lacus TaxID=2483805 RepID=UPI00189417EF|nr:glycosyltransferase [Aquiflexum lacus]
MKTKILFFIGSLGSGGKERRLVELLTFLDNLNKYELILVSKNKEISFKKFFELNVKWITLDSLFSDLKSVLQFYRIANKINPGIIHTWGSVQTFMVLPFIIKNRNVKLVNSQITAAPPKISLKERLINQVNFYYSDVILSNSYAGLEVYNPPKIKSKVIYNGLNFDRFQNLAVPQNIKNDFDLKNKFTIVMIASFSKNKDYEKFFKVGIALNELRSDFTFIGVGFFKADFPDLFNEAIELTKIYPNLRPIPGTSNVESLVNACDLGVLFSNTEVHGEGISNSIIEYMALGKPVIANDAGGTKEVVRNGENGYLIKDETPEQIAKMINSLLDNPDKMKEMGMNSKNRILTEFTLSRMGGEFEKVYKSLI